jgi:hypothetical protein
VPMKVTMTLQEVKKEDITRELTPDQKKRLEIVTGAAYLIGFFFIVVVIAYAIALWKGKDPHKSVEDWLNRLGGALAGVVLAFVGIPSPEGQVKPPGNAPGLVAPVDQVPIPAKKP